MLNDIKMIIALRCFRIAIALIPKDKNGLILIKAIRDYGLQDLWRKKYGRIRSKI